MTFMDQPLLKPKEAAEQLGVNAKTIARWCRDGKLAHVKTLGGHRRIPVSEVERLKTLQ